MSPPTYYIGVTAIPVVVVGTAIFYKYRGHWPINERAPWLIMLGASIVLAANALLLNTRAEYDGDEPCSLISLAVHVILLPLGSLLYVIRAAIIFFKLNITAELALRQKAHDHDHGGGGGGLVTEHTPVDGPHHHSHHHDSGHGSGTGAAGMATIGLQSSNNNGSGIGGHNMNSNDDDGHNRIHSSVSQQPHPSSAPSLAITTSAPVISSAATATGGSPIPPTAGPSRPHIGINMIPLHPHYGGGHHSTSVAPAPATPPLVTGGGIPQSSSGFDFKSMTTATSVNGSTTISGGGADTKTFISQSAPASPRGSTIVANGITINPSAAPLVQRHSLVHHSPGTNGPSSTASRQVTINGGNNATSPGGAIALTFMGRDHSSITMNGNYNTHNGNGSPNGGIASSSRPASAGTRGTAATTGGTGMIHHVTVASHGSGLGSPIPPNSSPIHHAHHHSAATTGGSTAAAAAANGGHTSAYTFGRMAGTGTVHGGHRRHHRSSASIRTINWYVQHIWMIRRRFLSLVFLAVLLVTIAAFLIIALGMGRGACMNVANGWRDAQTIIACVVVSSAGLALLGLSRKLWRHGFDMMMKMKIETLFSGLIVLAFGILIPIMVYIIKDQSAFFTAILIWSNVTWIMMALYPLYIARRHYLRQRALVNDVQRLTTLEQLIAIPEGLQAFQVFLAKEFNSECLAFWSRASKFAKMKELVLPLLASASASGAALPSIPASSSMVASANDDDRIVLIHHPAKDGTPPVPLTSPALINISASTKNPPSPVITGATRLRDRPSPILTSMSSSMAPSTMIWPARVPRASIALAEAYAVHRLFVEHEAPFEVNLSSAARRSIALHLQSMTNNLARERRTSVPDLASPATAMAIATTGGVASMPSLSLANQFTSHGPTSNGGKNSPGGTAAAAGGHHHHHHGGTLMSTTAMIAEATLLKSILSTYDDAIAEVMKLMNLNSFARFRASSAYTALIESLQRQGTIALPAIDTAGAANGDDGINGVTSPSGGAIDAAIADAAAAVAAGGLGMDGNGNQDAPTATGNNNGNNGGGGGAGDHITIINGHVMPAVVHTMAWADAPLPTSPPTAVVDLPPLTRLSPTAAQNTSAMAAATTAGALTASSVTSGGTMPTK